ncbi:MAG: CoA transferase [Pseudomonadales bacterium]|nr:CoA transferase [Pseudomonadales bacterium]
MLSGVKVVEMATYVAGPSAGGIMRDWGAAVIKVESPKGDPWRVFPTPTKAEDVGNPLFDLDNRGKRAIALDISRPEGLEALIRLIREADVFITNTRPSALERAGLDYESLKKENSRLIYSSVSGYGIEGEERDRPGFDMAAFWSRAGACDIMTPKGEEPIPLRTAAGDHVTGLTTLGGIMGALYEREKTGKGRLVETSLMRSGIYMMSSDYAIQLRFGKLAATPPREKAATPLTNFFQAGDGKWFCYLTRQLPQDWVELANAIGLEKYAEDERFASKLGRRKNSEALVALLDETFAHKSMREWGVILDAADLVWAPVLTSAEVVEDSQAAHLGAFVDVTRDNGQVYKSVATPVRFHDGEDARPRGDTPDFGQHSVDILKEYGYSDSEITAMLESGIAVGQKQKG